jgi:hypothetical protein
MSGPVTPSRIASSRLANARLVPVRVAPLRLAPFRSTPESASVPERSTPDRSTPRSWHLSHRREETRSDESERICRLDVFPLPIGVPVRQGVSNSNDLFGAGVEEPAVQDRAVLLPSRTEAAVLSSVMTGS